MRDQPKADVAASPPREGANARRRFETDAAEHTASHRGRIAYAKLWRYVFSANQLLLPQLVEACWASKAARRVILGASTASSQVDPVVTNGATSSEDTSTLSAAEKEVPPS